MHYALRVGVIPVETGKVTAFLAVDDRGRVAPVVAASDEEGLREIARAAAGDDVLCEPALAKAARRLGMRSGPVPAWTSLPRAEVATLLHLGDEVFERDALAVLGPALRGACELAATAPWTWLKNADIIDFEITRKGSKPRRFEGCVMGAGGQEHGVALYDKPGSMARLAEAMNAGRIDEAQRIDAYGLTLDEGPRWVADVVAAAYGFPLAITPIRVHGGKPRPIRGDDLWLMAGAAGAAAALTPRTDEATIELGTERELIEVTARLREPKAQARSRSRSRKPTAPVAATITATKAEIEETKREIAALRAAAAAKGAIASPAAVGATKAAKVRRVAAEAASAVAKPAPAPTARPTRTVAAPAAPATTTGAAAELAATGAADVSVGHDANPFCTALGIEVPDLAEVRHHPEARPFSLMVAALLERGAPMTLAEVAERLVAVGAMPSTDRALRSLQRSRPGRAPVYRDGDRYTLDPHSDETELLVSILDLRPLRRSGEANDARTYQRRHKARAEALVALHRVVLHAIPAAQPRAVALIDVDSHAVTTLIDDELAGLGAHLAAYDLVAGVDVRGVLRALGLDPQRWRLSELGSSRKTTRVFGRTTAVTTTMMIEGSCDLAKPLGDVDRMIAELRRGNGLKVRRRLEADARSLLALHEYGRLHGMIRVRSELADELHAAAWYSADEPSLSALTRQAAMLGVQLEVVRGAMSALEDPWIEARRVRVEPGAHDHELVMIDDDGVVIEDLDVVLARLTITVH